MFVSFLYVNVYMYIQIYVCIFLYIYIHMCVYIYLHRQAADPDDENIKASFDLSCF